MIKQRKARHRHMSYSNTSHVFWYKNGSEVRPQNVNQVLSIFWGITWRIWQKPTNCSSISKQTKVRCHPLLAKTPLLWKMRLRIITSKSIKSVMKDFGTELMDIQIKLSSNNLAPPIETISLNRPRSSSTFMEMQRMWVYLTSFWSKCRSLIIAACLLSSTLAMESIRLR